MQRLTAQNEVRLTSGTFKFLLYLEVGDSVERNMLYQHFIFCFLLINFRERGR